MKEVFTILPTKTLNLLPRVLGFDLQRIIASLGSHLRNFDSYEFVLEPDFTSALKSSHFGGLPTATQA